MVLSWRVIWWSCEPVSLSKYDNTKELKWFIPTLKAIYILGWLVERFEQKKRNLYLLFIDLEKAFNRILRELLCHVLEEEHVHKQLMGAIKDMYDRVVAILKTIREKLILSYFTIGYTKGPFEPTPVCINYRRCY